jgi:chemotaxis protein MotB
MEDKKQPIIVKKVVKGGGHHGGAWKVAYADFVTAMMAFFLLMWLLGTTTEEQRGGISSYFQNPAGIQGPGGASTSMIKLGGTRDMPQVIAEVAPDEKTAEEIAEEQEKKRLQTLMDDLEDAIGNHQALKPFKDHLKLDITPEGLRLQIVDRENRTMFDSGSAELKSYTVAILREIATVVNSVPHKISISGHTDARPYLRKDYTNWELSADRANAARRALRDGGLAEAKMGRVVGLGSSVLFDKEDPYNPVNRRISIIVMNKSAADTLEYEGAPGDGPVQLSQALTEPSP